MPGAISSIGDGVTMMGMSFFKEEEKVAKVEKLN
jgi:hypothetical protein